MTVKELEDVGIIREIIVQKMRNSHSICTVSLFMENEEDLYKLKKQIGKEVCIEDDKRILMRGTIREISCGKAYSGSKAVVRIISYSDKVDKNKKERVFQNIHKKYKDIFEILNSEDGMFQIVDKAFSTLEEPLILLQSDQTDFEFACDVAHNCGYSLFINDTDSRCTIYIGKNCGGAKLDISDEDMIFYNLVLTESVEKLMIKTRQFLELGQVTNYDNQVYVVVSVKIKYKDRVTHFEYMLERELDFKNNKKYITTHLGKAKVVSNADPDNLGRIQVEFLNYKDCMKENLMWIPYIPCLTEKDQGLVLIPGKDEIVYVFSENGQCYSSGCIRENALNDRIKNVENRMILFKDKFVSLSDEKVEMELFSYRVTIEDNLFILEKEDDSIKIEKDKLLVKYGDSKINLNGDTIQLMTNSKVEVKANEINLAGDRKISAKTSSFDVG